MKCPKCGYVSFDDVDVCKGCGAAIGTEETAEPEEPSPLQDELFAEDSQEGAGADPGEANGAEEAEEEASAKDESYWRERTAEAQKRVEDAKAELADANASINHARRAESAIDDPNVAYQQRQARVLAEARSALEAISTIRPRYITATRSATRRTTPRS